MCRRGPSTRYRRTLPWTSCSICCKGPGSPPAIGIRPFLPFVLTAALASADVGLDFDGTDFAFLEEWWFVIAVAVVVIGLELIERRREIPPIVWALLAVAVALGALVGAGSLADNDRAIVPGVVAGALAATLGFYAARSLFTRVRRRLDPDAQTALPIYGEAAGLAAAGLSILFPPLAILVIAALVVAPARQRAAAPARSTPDCASCGDQEARPRRHRRDEAGDARADGRRRPRADAAGADGARPARRRLRGGVPVGDAGLRGVDRHRHRPRASTRSPR